MSNITFSIQNPGTKPVNEPELYLGQANQLNFLFSNSLDIPNVNPGDVFTIKIPDDLISSASTDQLISKNWKMVQKVVPQNGFYSYKLTPLKEISFSDPITISLQKLTPITATNGDVTIDLKIEGAPISGPSQKLFAVQAPNQKSRRLLDYISSLNPPLINENQQQVPRGTIYISPTTLEDSNDVLTPPIANEIHLNLKFNGSQLVDNWERNKPPRFMFSFSYGTENSDLTNALKSKTPEYNPDTSAWNIKAEIAGGENNQWQLQKLNENSTTPVWVVEPTTANKYLFSNGQPNLDIVFTHVISALAPGNASVYIQWADIPGFNPGHIVLDIPKQIPNPKIISFTNENNNYSSVEPVVLDWQTFGAAEVELSWTNNANSNSSGKVLLPAYPERMAPDLIYKHNNKTSTEGYIIPPFMATNVSYACRLKIPGKEATLKELTLNLEAASASVISQFDVKTTPGPEGMKLTASWLVETDNVNAYCVLKGVEGRFPLNSGKGQPYVHEFTLNTTNRLSSGFTLTVKGFEPEVSRVSPLSFKLVQTIKGFQAAGVTPDSSKLFLNKGDNKLYYVNPFSIPDAPTSQPITIGDAAKWNFYLFFNPGGKQVFAVNLDGPKPPNTEYIYYFDSDAPPATVSNKIDTNGLGVGPPFGSSYFAKGGKRVFFAGLSLPEPGIFYFDPTNPPQKINQKINFPISDKGVYKNMLVINPDSSEALAYTSKVAIKVGPQPPLNIYRFNLHDPPSELSGSAPLDSRLLNLKYTGDGDTIFANILYTKEIAYFPAANLPVKATNTVNVGHDSYFVISPKSNWVFSPAPPDVLYFSNEKPPAKATLKVGSNGAENLFNATFNPDQSMVFMTDGGNKVYYFDVINPPKDMSEVTVGGNSGPLRNIYFTPDGSRVFINNSGDNTVSVLEAYIP